MNITEWSCLNPCFAFATITRQLAVIPPIVSDEDRDIYIGYFENRHGEQWLFTCHRKTRKVELRGGDIDWNTVHKVENGTVEGLILNAEERAWLQACWRAAVSW